jgi:transcriptional regulator with XRE-family HTH domain
MPHRDSSIAAGSDPKPPARELARIVTARRVQLGLTQFELGERMSAPAAVISRIETGRHRISTKTLRRLAIALDGQAVLGFDFGTPEEPQQTLITF